MPTYVLHVISLIINKRRSVIRFHVFLNRNDKSQHGEMLYINLCYEFYMRVEFCFMVNKIDIPIPFFFIHAAVYAAISSVARCSAKDYLLEISLR